MKTNIRIFTNQIFGEIRTCQVDNQIMFVGKDVATALGYKKKNRHIADKQPITSPIKYIAKRPFNNIIIS